MLPKAGSVRRAFARACCSSRAIAFLAFAVLALTLWTSCTTSVFAVGLFEAFFLILNNALRFGAVALLGSVINLVGLLGGLNAIGTRWSWGKGWNRVSWYNKMCQNWGGLGELQLMNGIDYWGGQRGAGCLGSHMELAWQERDANKRCFSVFVCMLVGFCELVAPFKRFTVLA